MAGGLDVVLTCWPTRPSKRVVVDRADVGDQSPQGDGGGLRRSGGEALVPVVQAACLGSSLLSGARMTGWRGTPGDVVGISAESPRGARCSGLSSFTVLPQKRVVVKSRPRS